jgi:chromosome partitioning related protein ParA
MANPGAFCADANLNILLVDLNARLLLSSSCRLDLEALGGTCQLISQNPIRFKQVIIRTCNPDLSLIVSNDRLNQLSHLLLLHAADGRLLIRNLGSSLAHDFDLALSCNRAYRRSRPESSKCPSQLRSAQYLSGPTSTGTIHQLVEVS